MPEICMFGNENTINTTLIATTSEVIGKYRRSAPTGLDFPEIDLASSFTSLKVI
jgi:hypothetical protein